MATDPAFEAEVLSAFSFLSLAVPARLLHSDYDPAAFGNALIGIEYDQLRLRVSRDRGQVLVELSPRWVAADWFDEDVVVELVAGRDAAAELEVNTNRPLAEAADAIRAYLPAILERFASENWASTRILLTELQNARAARLFGEGARAVPYNER